MIPELRGYLPYYTMHSLNSYYRERLEKNTVPFHYHLNRISHDWEINLSESQEAKSNMLEAAIEAGYVDPIFRNAIVIAIQDNYANRVPDLRTYEVMSSRILAPLNKILKLGTARDTIFWFDEVFDINKYQQDFEEDKHSIKYPYSVLPMKYFDRVQFNIESRRFV
jgi:hypothetical protein